MKTSVFVRLSLAVISAAAVAAFTGDLAVQQSSLPSTTELRTMTARFAPADIGADISALPENERRALAKLVQAGRIMDGLFLRQVWSGNDAMLQRLAREAVTRSGPARAEADARLHAFLVNKGPWSRLDHNRIFVAGAIVEIKDTA